MNRKSLFVFACTLIWSVGPLFCQEKQSVELPRFIVPGKEKEIKTLQKLFARHHSPHTNCTLWDAWLPHSVLWPAVGDEMSAQKLRDFYRYVFLNRFIDSKGYVAMDQHQGLAHPNGWPFPTWRQAGGAGWHFTHHNDGYSKFLKIPLTTLQGWKFEGSVSEGIDPVHGLKIKLTKPNASLTAPECAAYAFSSPYIVLQWDDEKLPAGKNPILQWTTKQSPEFAQERQIEIKPEFNYRPAGGRFSFTTIPVYQHALWKGTIQQIRIQWNNQESADLTFRAMHTAVDTRHPITNVMFVVGSTEYFNWTTDTAFLQKNIKRMRKAIQYTVDEFAVRENGCVLVSWPGHSGRPGFEFDEKGKKIIHLGRGVGNNYWDLMPFGHKDCLATIYLFDALNRMAALEREIENHPQWKIAPPAKDFSGDSIQKLASEIQQKSSQLFWDKKSERFVGCIDSNSVAHDYGFTFLNLEAIHYGFATAEQAKKIFEWVDGKRIVQGDTSQGKEIYYWEFAPRATTKRNIDWYVWAWSGPEAIPWGGQVQDGGAVLGFSYFDLMSRIKTHGPDDAWKRLQAILSWDNKVQQEGGYRTYFSKPGRGTLQGGGTAGGLGIDAEFLETALVPQTMLYGFLGLKPIPEGFSIEPKLPSSWPSLKITRIHVRDYVIDISASRNELSITANRIGKEPLKVVLPNGKWEAVKGDIRFFKQFATLQFVPENRTITFSRK